MDTISYRGKWIFTAERNLLNDGYIVCAGNRIREIARSRPSGKVVEHDGLITPGLVNAHTHLEFSDLSEPLGEPHSDFVDWIGLVIRHRLQRDPASVLEACRAGLVESIQSGVSAIGEISTVDLPDAQWSPLDEVSNDRRDHIVPGLWLVDFREILGFRLEQVAEIDSSIDAYFNSVPSKNRQLGLSPHAPYSVNRKSLERAVQVSRQRQVPLAMHLAETESELELLQSHQGRFFDLLNRLELWSADNFPRGTRPLDFLQTLSNASKALVIHGNYLSEPEFKFLAEHSNLLKLVFCPRTHAYFGHSTYPMELVSKYKIKLAIGTDSRASNPDLSVWRELETVHRSFPWLDPAEVLEMGTSHGAQALGLEHRLGTIEPGKQSSLFFAPQESELAQAIINH